MAPSGSPEEVLRSSLERVCDVRGLTVTDSGFFVKKELSYRWQVGSGRFTFFASDYMEDAPREAMDGFTEGAVSRILDTRRNRKPFGDAFTDYIKSDDFVLSKRPVYLKRSRNLAMNETGQYRSIADSINRLYDMGLLRDSDIDNAVITWTKKPNYNRVGYCSTMFRVVTISSVLDSPDFTERALDEVVYHECMHLRQGYRPFDPNPHDAEFHRNMKLFTGLDEAEKEIGRIPYMKPRKGSKRA